MNSPRPAKLLLDAEHSKTYPPQVYGRGAAIELVSPLPKKSGQLHGLAAPLSISGAEAAIIEQTADRKSCSRLDETSAGGLTTSFVSEVVAKVRRDWRNES